MHGPVGVSYLTCAGDSHCTNPPWRREAGRLLAAETVGSSTPAWDSRQHQTHNRMSVQPDQRQRQTSVSRHPRAFGTASVTSDEPLKPWVVPSGTLQDGQLGLAGLRPRHPSELGTRSCHSVSTPRENHHPYDHKLDPSANLSSIHVSALTP